MISIQNTQTPLFLHPDEVTPAVLSHMMNSLKQGEKICLGPGKSGKIEISIEFTDPQSGKKKTKYFENKTFGSLSATPAATGGWGFTLPDMDDTDVREKQRERNKEVKHAQNSHDFDKRLARTMIDMLLAFADVEQASRISGGGSSKLMFAVDDLEIYTSENLTPIKYRNVGQKEFNFV